MSDRDELQELVAYALNHPQHGEFALDSLRVATRIIAAGYRKPRTITTAKELDALALPAIIDSPNGGMAKVEHMAGPGITQKYAEFLFGDDESADEIYALPHFATFALPAVVLKECAQ
jgi:hypothetical protein